MRKVYLLLLTVLFATISRAQVANYSFAASSGAYSAIVGTVAHASGWDDANATVIPIGFSFTFNGVAYTTCTINTNGYITFGATTPPTGTPYTPISDATLYSGAVSAFGRDDQAQATAPLGLVQYTSAAGVFTVQWSDTRRYNGAIANVERFEFQIKLFQTTNVIQIIYGNWSNAVSATTANNAQVGLRGATNADFKNLAVASGGNWAAPAAGTLNTDICFYNESNVATKPASGQIYTFTPPPPCVTPAGQASGLILSPFSTSQINGSFTATAADGYLVVRYPTGSATTAPVNGTIYTAGNTLGLGRVVSASALTTFNATGLTPNTTYDFYVYSYNNLGVCTGPTYNITTPLSGTQTSLPCTGLAGGTYTVGPTGTYASLTAVTAALSSGTTGPVIFELQSTYLSTVETFPVTFTGSACPLTGGVTIRPQTGATGLSITSANATGTINLNGAGNITFDGRAGGAGPSQLTISNTNITGYAVQLINSATFNTIKYCTVSGVNNVNASGVIVFNNAVGLTTGNSNNTIDNCDLRDGATTPTNLIYCSGNTADYASQNNNNTVSNCTIHDWFNATSTTASAAIRIVGGASDWTINANSFYQTATRTFTMTTATDEGAIAIASATFGTNFTISNNFIGGSAPLCGGTPWTYTGGATGTPTAKMINLTAALGAYSNITGNTLQNIAITSSTINNLSGLISHVSGNVNISNNTLGSQSVTDNVTFTLANTTVGVFYLPLGFGLGGVPCNVNVTNNNIGGITVSTSSTGSVSFRIIYGQPVVGSLCNISNNTIGGTVPNSIQQLSNNLCHGILFLGASVDNVFSNNTVRNLTQNNAGVTGTIVGVNIQTTGGRSTVTGNTVFNFTTNGTNIAINNAASVVGVSVTSPLIGNNTISGNTIYNLTNTNTTVAGWVNGITYTTPAAPQPNSIISRNLIHSLNQASVTGGMAGILSLSTAPVIISNNMIRLGIDASGASITNSAQINGIYKANTGNISAYFNTIYIGGTGVVGGTVNTYAYRKAFSATVDTIMNNIFYNVRSNASGTGKHYSLLLNAATLLFSNYNDLLANGTGGVMAINSVTDYTTLAAWRTATNQDWNSISADPNLANPTGTSATVDLHIGAGATPIEQAGYNLASITDDFDAQARAGLTPVDVSADAGNFTVSDIAPPVIYLVPLLANACSVGDRAVNGINITDATGVPTSGTQRPRIYYRKAAGAWFSQPGTLASGTGTNGTWNFTIVAADMGGLAPADVVSYYIVAQDLVATPNLASNAGGAISATNDVNNITTQPTTPNTYTVTGVSLSGNYNVGTGQTYTTLTAAVTAYNTACLNGPVTFSLTDASYAAETFPITIAANPYASATNTLTIKPTLAGTTISGTSATGLIVLNAADWITINGSISATNNTVCPAVAASRDLTLTNTNASTTSAVIWLQSTAAFDGATNNNIRNLNLVGSANTATFVGVGSGSTTISTASLGVGNNNNTYINNNISKTQYGVFSQGNSLGAKNTGTVINQNLINTVAPNNTARGGILVGFENGIIISGNNISEISLASSPDVFGIALGGIAITTTGFTGNEVTNAVVTKNIIGSVRNTGNSFSACGLFVATALSGTTLIANNMISGVSANPTPGDFTVGILLGGGNGSTTQVYYNTVTMTNLNPLTGSTNHSYALAVGGTTPNPIVDIRNNILVNYQSNGSLNSYAIGYGYTPHTNLTSDHNDYYVGAGAAFFIGATGSLATPTNQLTTANLQAATLKDGSAKNVLPAFVSATDLHLQPDANCQLDGAGVAVSVTDDIDCQTRTNFDLGADEFTNTFSLVINNPAAVCSPATVNITLAAVTAGSSPGLTLTYWTDAAATIVLATPTAIATSGTYYIKAVKGNCSVVSPVVVVVNTTPNAIATPSSQTTCSGAAITTIVLSGAVGGTVYNWTRDNTVPVTGIAASGSGDISGSLTNTTAAPVTVTFTITPTASGCTGTPITATVLVNPTPNAVATPSSQIACSGNDFPITTIVLTGSVSGTVFNWTRDNNVTVTGNIPASGSGNISGYLDNTTSAPITVTFTITPTANGCPGTPITATVLVNPTPDIVATPSSQTVCSGVPITTIVLSGAVSGTTYNWTRDNTGFVTGIPASGSGNISGTLTNTIGGPVTVTFTITPTANGCDGYPVDATVVVNPSPQIFGSVLQPTTCVSNDGGIFLGMEGPFTFFWTTVGGSGIVQGQQSQFTLSVGQYTVVVTNTITGCQASATFNLTGPGNCAICPTIPSVTTSPTPAACAGASVTLTASGLTDMGITYGITFKYSLVALADPYTGGTVIATIPNGSLGGGGTTATTTTTFPVSGNYFIYAILSPTPTDPLCRPSASVSLTVSPVPAATISYAGSPYCSNAGTATVTRTGTAGGTYSSTAGLTLNAANGDVTLGTSTPGTYTVTYTIAASGGCAAFTTTASITITAAPSATIVYAGSPYCSNAGTATVTRTGTAGGTYSSTAGLTLNAANGDVTLGTSTPGTYTVTYTIAAAGGCAVFTTTASITITAAPSATIVYAGSPYCSNAGTATVTRTGTAGGTYSSTAGLTLNAANGDVTLGTSTPGTYTVTYTIAAAGGCASFTTTASITITAAPSATIVYAGSPYCSNAGTATVTRTGTAGGTYSSTAGLTLNAANGDVTLGTSTPGTYTVTYTIAAAGGCAVYTTTTSITINPIPNAVATPSSQTACSGVAMTTIVLSGAVSGTTYNWTRDNQVNVTGIPNSGSGNISGTPINNTAVQQTVTFTITPTANGCTGTPITATMIVNKAPVITCPANISVNNTPGLCGANVTYPPATATGAPPPVITYSQASGTFFPVGTTTVTATATNSCGTVTCTFTITVVDNQPPTIVCPANITANNTPGLCSAVVTYPLPTASDNCPFPGGVPLTITQNSSNTITAGSVSCNAGGIHTDNSYWRAFDLGPMALTGPFTINTVRFGVELATGTGGTQPVTVRIHTSAGAFPGGVRTQVATQTFNVPNQTLSLFTANFTTPPTVPANAILVLEIFTPAGAGNSFFIGSNALPETAPSYLSAAACGVPNPVTVASLGFPNMHIVMNASGTVANPSGSMVQIAGLPSGSVFPVGVTTNTFRVTDAAGNTATCSFNVTVVDNQAPTVTCPANIVANTNAGVCTANVTTPNPTTADNCAVTTVTWVMTGATTGSSPATGINFVGTRTFNLNGTTGQGVTTITYTVRDAAGNTSTCSFTVTVNDAAIPAIGGQPSNQTVCVGTNAVFSVTATVPAGDPLTYQWQVWTPPVGPWVNITGATNATLPLNAVTFAMNTNSYRVILTGRCSVVTSGVASLYVNQLPTVSIVASIPPVLLPGQSVTLTAVVNPGGGSYQWFKNGVAISGATGASLSGLTVDDIGSYTVRYTDLNGCIQTSAAMAVSGQVSDGLWIYPNPNEGHFHIRLYNHPNEEITVRIFDTKGALVYTRKAITGATAYFDIDIDISNDRFTASENYIVNVIGSDGRLIGSKLIQILQQ